MNPLILCLNRKKSNGHRVEKEARGYGGDLQVGRT